MSAKNNDIVASTSRRSASARDIKTEFDSDFNSTLKKHRLSVIQVLLGWNLCMLKEELGTREKCIKFAEQQNLVPLSKKCRIHRQEMRINTADHNLGYFVCNKGNCRWKTNISRAKGTWFENVKIDLVHVFYLMYAYAHNWTLERVMWEDILKKEKNQCLSSATISDWFSYCRKTVVIHQLEQQQNTVKIGGPGKIVQIVESKFGKRKYNKGRHIDGHWILGMIEEGKEDLRLEVCSENDRSATVLVSLIKKHVMDGTTIHTHTTSWRATDYCLNEHGFIHKIVNHCDPDNTFVTEDGTLTQRTESQWRVLKRFFYKEDSVLNFADGIVEFRWRQKIKNSFKDPFYEFLDVVKNIYKLNKY